MRILIPLLTRARITFNDLSIADEKSQSIPNMYRSGENLNETFTFASLTAYGAWNDDMQLMITIHRNSALIYTYTTTYSF
ncbi:unnamed protein product [Rotaria sp. Silwood1]|nr:unnamed protein product [Rotaria sp. Silwood1]CAF1674598.1 unnamed protein product [Rotaria sp. Silwood1]